MKKNLATKVLSLLLACVMVFSLVACNNTTNKETDAPTKPTDKATEAPTGEGETNSGETEAPTNFYPMETDKSVSVYLGASKAALSSVYKNYDESWWHSRVEGMTGIGTEWVDPVQDQVALEMMLLDPKEAPNIIFYNGKGTDGYKTMVDDGIALDLTDYLEEYAPNYWEYVHRPENAELLKMTTDDEGRFYFIPGMAESDFNLTYMGFVVRKDWLDECNLSVPVTLEDYKNVLTAFKDKYGARFLAEYSNLRTAGIASGTGAYLGIDAGIRERDGKVVFEPLSTEWQKQVETYADWKKNDLLDGDFFSADGTLLRQKVAEGKVGLTYVPMSQMTNFILDAEESKSGAEWVAIEYPREAAGVPTTCIQTNHLWQDYCSVLISAHCPEELIPVCLRWLDYFWTEEGIMFANFGIEGETYEIVDGKPQFTDLVMKDETGLAQAVQKYTAWDSAFVGIQKADYLRAKNANTPAVVEAIEIWTNNTEAGKHLTLKVLRTDAEKQAHSDVYSPIRTYVRERVAAYINGSEEIDWAKFVKTIEDMGIKQSTDAYQAAYDRYTNK